MLKRSACYYRVFSIFFFHSFSLLVCVFMLIANLTATLLFKKEKYYLNKENSPRSFLVSNENKNHNSSVTRNNNNWLTWGRRYAHFTLTNPLCRSMLGRFRDGPLEKLWEGGGRGSFRTAGTVFVIKFLVWIFFRP